MTATFLQRRISPLATRLAAGFFQNRRVLAEQLKRVYQALDEGDQFKFTNALVTTGLIKNRFRQTPVGQLVEYHLPLRLTLRKIGQLVEKCSGQPAAEAMLQALVMPGNHFGERRFTLSPGQTAADYYQHQIVAATRQDILALVERRGYEEAINFGKIIDEAVKIVTHHNDEATFENLLYRSKRVAEAGGNIITAVAVILQEIPIAELETLLTQESAGEIYKLGTALIKVIKKYQAVKESFSFSLDQARSDPDYIEGKMKELIERCRYFSTFSLFLFDQLERCYSLVAAEDPLLEKVRFIFAPLVERLQLIFLADDFRDRYLRITNPGKYGWIKENVIHSRLEMDYKTAKMYLRDFVAALREQLRQHYPQMLAGLSWIYWRVKSPFSIWNKVEVRRKYDYTKLRDILAVKITTKTLADLWKLAKILKHEFAVREEDIEDDITCPRESGWQALTIVVHDDQRRPIEIQLMTSEMNYRNTFVMAATWEYTLKRDLKTVGINRQNFASHINGLMCSDPEKNFHRLYDHWVGA